MKDKNLKTKWLHLRLSEDEHNQLLLQFSKTTERKISSYARKILLGKPLVKGVRNLSLEALITEFSPLLKDLNGVANNFNQAVHKLHTLDRAPEFQRWILAYEADKSRLLESIEIIKTIIRKTSHQWLQS